MSENKNIPKEGEVYRHHSKRTYLIIGVSNLDTDKPNDPDWIPQVFYRCLGTGKLWSRPLSEFTSDKYVLV